VRARYIDIIVTEYTFKIQRKYYAWKLENVVGNFYELAMRDYKEHYETQLTEGKGVGLDFLDQI
jgi:hypothetical protein